MWDDEHLDDGHLLPALQHRLSDVIGIHALPDARPWSRSYAVERRVGDRLYLKGTPRSRPEAATTAFLATCCPTYLPHVLQSDVLPTSAWCWFLTADAGTCSHTALPLHLAEQAAFALGHLQRVMHTAPVLAHTLPKCLPHQLQQVALAGCDWLIQQAHPAIDAAVHTYRTRIAKATTYFTTLTHHLAAIPATCVHGDFWPGNIAVQHDRIKVIDWGEAVWGVGGASIWNLLLNSQATLAPHVGTIWHAYQQGWERNIAQDYIAAARMAFAVTMLVVDSRYVPWHPTGVDLVPSMLTTLQQVVCHLE